MGQQMMRLHLPGNALDGFSEPLRPYSNVRHLAPSLTTDLEPLATVN